MIWTIAARELTTRGKSKGFIAITAILFLAVIGGAIASSLLTGGDDEAREIEIGLTGDGIAFEPTLGVGNDDLDPTITTYVDASAATEAVSDGTVDVLFDGEALIWEGYPDDDIGGYVAGVVQQSAFGERANQLGLSPTDIGTLFTEVELEEVRLDGGETERTVRLIAGGVAGLATFFLLQTWGSFVMMGVIEEKSSKVVEILLSQVRPTTLLTGKVIGLGILAFAQMLIIVLGLVIGLNLASDIEIPPGVWASVPLLVLTFVLGFAFYSTLFAAVGSTVSRQEDAMSAQLPAMLPLFVGYIIAAASLGNSENLALTIGSFVPFTSPILLPLRTAMVDMPAWQVAVSLAILVGSAALMLQLAGQIYRYTLLRTGSPVKLKDAWRNRKAAEL